jgi:hypothetical protein
MQEMLASMQLLLSTMHTLLIAMHMRLTVIEIEIEIEIVYNMYRMRRFFTKKPYAPAAVSGPSQLCHTGNIQVRARP